MRIIDNGVGFDPDMQSPNADSIGLANAKEAHGSHDGRGVSVIRSKPGKGTTVEIRIFRTRKEKLSHEEYSTWMTRLLAVRKFEAIASTLPDVVCAALLHRRRRRRWHFARLSTRWTRRFWTSKCPEMRGIDLGDGAAQVWTPSIRIFFVTAYDRYALDAFGVNALGYLLKPYNQEMLARELDKAKRMQDIPRRAVYIQTIPSFDVYVDGALFPITSPKPKELLALAGGSRGRQRWPRGWLITPSCGRTNRMTTTPRRSTA